MASLPKWDEESDLIKGFHILDIGFACSVIVFAILYMTSGFKNEVWISDCDCATGGMFFSHGVRFYSTSKKIGICYMIIGIACIMVGLC